MLLLCEANNLIEKPYNVRLRCVIFVLFTSIANYDELDLKKEIGVFLWHFYSTGEPVSVIERKLDACTVSVYPPLNPDHESLTVPETMLIQLGIVQKVSTDGIFLTGADMIYNYEQVSFMEAPLFYSLTPLGYPHLSYSEFLLSFLGFTTDSIQ